METTLLEQVFRLLSTDAGNLTYHLVLAFSAAGALQVSLLYSQRSEPTRLKRALLGFTLLVLLQFVLFAYSGLAWQGLVESRIWLPALDRAVSLISLVVIVWLWAFPDASPSADAAAALLGLLALAAALLGALWWSNQPGVAAAAGGAAMNGSAPDLLFLISCLLILVLGMALLVSRRPDEWELGASMLVFLGIGVVMQLILAPAEGNYPAFVRLFQMAAFPFLFVLPQRALLPVYGAAAPGSASAPAAGLPADKAAGQLYADPALWQSLQTLAAEPDLARSINEGVAAIARSLQADFCLLLEPPGEDGRVALACIYELATRRYRDRLLLDARSLPILVSAFKMGRSRRLAGNVASPDAATLARALQLESAGNLLFASVLNASGSPLLGMLLLSPDSGRDWSPEEQSFLGLQVRLLAQFLQRSRESTAIREELAQARQMARIAQDQAQQVVDENQKLRDQAAVIHESARRDQFQIASMAGLVASHAAAGQRIEELRLENERLQEALRQASEAASSRNQNEGGELRLALQEIAYLQEALVEADQKMTSLKLSQAGSSVAAIQLQNIINIAQDLRQPLASIVGYTDFLLGESVGILSAAQRKYLERTKVSTERINRLLDDLIQAASVESNPSHLDITDVDVCKVVKEATLETNDRLRRKRIALQLDLPGRPLPVAADHLALRRVIVNLLSNAGAVTPDGGGVTVSARLESSDNDQDFVLLQVTDHGGGIAVQDLPHVFAARATHQPIVGLSDNGADMASVKSLVEVLGGRAWVDSDPGQGATFSVLLPTHTAQAQLSDDRQPGSNGQGAA